jgi:KDO2-lipid IV(A) lauroyltransferase
MEKGWAYHAGKLLSKILCLLPYGFLVWAGRKLGILFFHIASRLRERGKHQMMRGLAISEEKAMPILKRMFGNVVTTMLEVLYLPNISPENVDQYVACEGLHYLDHALKEGNGAVIMTAHFGNWELCALTLAMKGYPMIGLAKPQPNAGITTLLTEFRTRYGGSLYYKGAALRQVIQALKDNKFVFVVSDQDGGKDGIIIDFLNKPASTPAGPAAFARRCSAPVIPVFMRRVGRKHLLVVDPPIELQETDNIKADIRYNLFIITKRVEEQIRKYPEEWLWFQKRWNTPVEVAKKHEHQ